MPKLAANLATMFTEVPFLDRFAAAARAGFKAVEYLFPYDHAPDRLMTRLRHFGLYQVLHNLPAGDWAAGERGIACHPGRVAEFRDGVELAIAYATALGCPQVNCLSGIVPDAEDPRRARQVLVDNLAFAADKLAAHRIRLLIEPINTFDIPGFAVSSVEAALAIMDEIGSGNLFLQYDFYHQQRMTGQLAETFRRHKDRIAHIRLADTPGRHVPGTGEIMDPFLLALLDREGYAGWIGCEYKPAISTQGSLGWAAGMRQKPAAIPALVGV